MTTTTELTKIEPVDEIELEKDVQVEVNELLRQPLDHLVVEMSEMQERIIAAKQRVAKVRHRAVLEARSLGCRLIAVKRQVKHGPFGAWLKTHCGTISQDTAERYMKLASKSAQVRNLPFGTTLSQAYRILEITKPAGLQNPERALCRDIKRCQGAIKRLSGHLKDTTNQPGLLKEIRSLQADLHKLVEKIETRPLSGPLRYVRARGGCTSCPPDQAAAVLFMSH